MLSSGTQGRAMDSNPHSTGSVPGYHPVTRWLHAALVLSVVFQLICAALMTHPKHADGKNIAHAINHEAVAIQPHMPVHERNTPGERFMEAHRTGGMLVALVVLANLLWAVIARGNPRKRQMAVLFSARYWWKAISIAKYIPLFIAGKKNLPEPGNALALVFEMLGLLVLSAMAITGVAMWNLWDGPGYHVSTQAEWMMEMHASVAVLLLLYLAGHVSMALMHARAGDPVFSRIRP